MYHTIDYPVTDVGVLVRHSGPSRLGVLSDNEQQTVAKLLDALIFAACYRERALSLARDNFDYTVWEFQGNRAPTKMVNLRSRRFVMNVVQNKPHLLQIPQHVHRRGLSNRSYDEDILHALLRCSYSDKPEDAQLMRALNWFNLAHADTHDLTEYTRFAMTAAAFEALLNTPDRGTTSYFRNAVQMLLGQNRELDKWAEKFYGARSQIVHGGEPGDMLFGEHKHNSLLFLADFIFIQCVYAMIGVRRYWPVGRDPTWLIRDVRRLLVSNKSRFKAINDFNLRMAAVKAGHAYDCLLSIQKYDLSVDLADCDQAVRSIIALALDGLSRISRMKDFRTDLHRDFLGKYREGFRTILAQVDAGAHLGVYQAFRQITDSINRVDSDDSAMWADAHIRGESFGHARRISLDTVISALYSIEDLRSGMPYR